MTKAEKWALQHKWATPEESNNVMWLIDELEAQRKTINKLRQHIQAIVGGFRALRELEENPDV